MSEERICLGWIINIRKMLVKLPIHKCITWIVYLDSFLDRSSISHKDLLSLIGKLENVITTVKMIGHFMNNLYSKEQKAKVSIPNLLKIQRRAKENAKLHHCFLKISKRNKYELSNLRETNPHNHCRFL